MNAPMHRIRNVEELDRAREIVERLLPIDHVVVEGVVVLWITVDGVVHGCGNSASAARFHACQLEIDNHCRQWSELTILEKIDHLTQQGCPLYVRVPDDKGVSALGELCASGVVTLGMVCAALGR